MTGASVAADEAFQVAMLPDLTAQHVPLGELDVRMASSDATARELVATQDGAFGADLLRFPPGGRVPMHMHVGDHVLLVLRGEGTLVVDARTVTLNPGTIYLVPGGREHAIDATSELVLVAIGNDRSPPGSAERLSLV